MTEEEEEGLKGPSSKHTCLHAEPS